MTLSHFMLTLACIVTCTACSDGCSPSYVRPAAYETELVACSEQSKTLADSITCENAVRTRYGRPLRAFDAGLEGGAK